MNPQLADLSDLRDWANRLVSRSQLPILLRRLILVTTGADLLRAPGGDAVGEHGWDIRLDVPGGCLPFVPDGSSRWEGGAGVDVRKKAQGDFKKRTDETPAAERAKQTFVFFTPRHFEDSEDWLEAKEKEKKGWAAVRVVDGVILEQWLENQPAVHIWFSELIGKLPIDVGSLSAWWERWSDATSPATPPGVLTAGRKQRADDLRAALRSPAAVLPIMADTTEEVLAFVAASLHEDGTIVDASATTSDPAPTGEVTESGGATLTVQTVPATGGADESAPDATGGESTSQSQGLEPIDSAGNEPLPARVALLARAVIVNSANAWARLALGTTPLILIPTFADPDVRTAVAAGHHVIAPSNTRRHDNPLPRIRVDEAADAFQRAGVEFGRSHEYARAARRSLSGLRRRLAKSGQFHAPDWSTGTATSMLGPMLLLGGWHEDHDADIELIEDLTDTKWRRLSRDLQTVARMEDPPIRAEAKAWEFLDPIDAWDLLADAVTSLDLEMFHDRLLEVVAEPDPVLDLPDDEQAMAGIRGIRRKYSPAIRRGMATTLAVLGAVVGDRTLQDGSTGQQHATLGVRSLLASDDARHWTNLAPLLPTLAEAAPDAFLDAVERAAAASGEPLRALFDEGPDSALGRRGSLHHHLLWALDNLTFSDRHASRALLLLARLAQDDPGGRSLNRPVASIVSALHLMHPQSAVTDKSRRDILGLLETRSPDVAWDVMVRLVEGTAGGTIFSASTPRWRDWAQPDTARSISQVYADVTDILERLAAEVRDRPARTKELVKLLPHPLPRERGVLLDAIVSAASTMDEPDRRAVAEALAELAARHRRAPSGAPWSMREDDVEAIAQAATTLADDVFAVPAVDWFAYWPRPADVADPDVDVDQMMDENRTSTIRTIYGQSGLPGVVDLAETSEAVPIVGQYLARRTDVPDAAVFALSPSIEDIAGTITQLVLGFSSGRFLDGGVEWLTAALGSADEDAQAVLLRACPATPEVLQLLDSCAEAVQESYWRHPLLAGIPDDSVRDYTRRLLDRGLAWSALVVLIAHSRKKSDRLADDAALEMRALEAVRTSTEDPREIFQHHAYGLGQLLDQLGEAGVDQTRLAQIEYFFTPLLEHARQPTALYREFVRNPDLFASVVIGSYRRETDSDEEGEATDADGEGEAAVNTADAKTADSRANGGGEETGADDAGPQGDPAGFEDFDLLDDDTARALFGRHGWSLLREWRGLPGQISKHEVNIDELQTWIETVLATLDAHDRRQSARHQVGQVLSSPITDADGTWPCRAVRDLLEQLQDPTIEEGILVGRFNQRGVTVRSPYDGGAQERTLAERYQAQADRLRDTWPRTGAILDDLAKGYAADARREDRNVDE